MSEPTSSSPSSAVQPRYAYPPPRAAPLTEAEKLEKQSRCVREAQVEFVTKATLFWALASATVGALHYTNRTFRTRLDWRPKLFIVAGSGVSIGYWYSEHKLMRCNRPDYDIGREWNRRW